MTSQKPLQPAGSNTNKNKGLAQKNEFQPAPSKQYVLDLGVEVQRDVNGIEMGILENGVPFLTQSGLAKLVGVARSVIFDISQEWEKHYADPELGKDRISWLKEHLFKAGYTEPKLFLETRKDGTVHNAYPDVVCMALLEYYAFEAKTKQESAVDNFRRLAKYGFQKFIYEALDYTPSDKWQYHHDRISILQNTVPHGYFSIFHETTGLVVDLIAENLTVNHKTVPDISIGLAWGKHWSENGMDQHFGERIKYAHDYPEYYPQALSNPQAVWAYPDVALGEFRRWFRQEYLPTKFPKYILSKAHILPGGRSEAERIAFIFEEKQKSLKKNT